VSFTSNRTYYAFCYPAFGPVMHCKKWTPSFFTCCYVIVILETILSCTVLLYILCLIFHGWWVVRLWFCCHWHPKKTARSIPIPTPPTRDSPIQINNSSRFQYLFIIQPHSMDTSFRQISYLSILLSEHTLNASYVIRDNHILLWKYLACISHKSSISCMLRCLYYLTLLHREL